MFDICILSGFSFFLLIKPSFNSCTCTAHTTLSRDMTHARRGKAQIWLSIRAQTINKCGTAFTGYKTYNESTTSSRLQSVTLDPGVFVSEAGWRELDQKGLHDKFFWADRPPMNYGAFSGLTFSGPDSRSACCVSTCQVILENVRSYAKLE